MAIGLAIIHLYVNARSFKPQISAADDTRRVFFLL